MPVELAEAIGPGGDSEGGGELDRGAAAAPEIEHRLEAGCFEARGEIADAEMIDQDLDAALPKQRACRLPLLVPGEDLGKPIQSLEARQQARHAGAGHGGGIEVHEIEAKADHAPVGQVLQLPVGFLTRDHGDRLVAPGRGRHRIEHGGIVEAIAARLNQQRMSHAMGVERGRQRLARAGFIRPWRIADARAEGDSARGR